MKTRTISKVMTRKLTILVDPEDFIACFIEDGLKLIYKKGCKEIKYLR